MITLAPDRVQEVQAFAEAASRAFPGADLTDLRPAPADGPAGDPRAMSKTIGLGFARQCAIDEAWRIRGTQDALVAAGLRSHVSADELRKADAFEFLARLIDRVKADADFMARLREGRT